MLHWLFSLGASLVSRNKLTIMIYHQVLPDRDPLRASEPDKAKFTWQMRLLSKYFNPLPMAEAIELLRKNELPPRSVCVTFDDGYLNNLEIAEPILRQFNVPATVFVASAFSDGQNMWNDRVIELFAQIKGSEINLSAAGLGTVDLPAMEQRSALIGKTLRALKYLPIEERLEKVSQLYRDNGDVSESRKMMTPQEVKQLSDAGIEIASHTHNHPILKGMDKEAVLDEIQTNKALLESWIEKPVTGFAYPNGKPGVDFDDQTVDVLRTLNFNYAVTTQWGIAEPGSDNLRLKRFTPWDEQPWKFHLRMLLNIIKNPQ